MEFRTGIYQHYKGQFYLVEGLARHSETGELYVVYIPLYMPDEGPVRSIRPLDMFLENVEVEPGKFVPRFKFISVLVGR